jgi:hypothetical protein
LTALNGDYEKAQEQPLCKNKQRQKICDEIFARLNSQSHFARTVMKSCEDRSAVIEIPAPLLHSGGHTTSYKRLFGNDKRRGFAALTILRLYFTAPWLNQKNRIMG